MGARHLLTDKQIEKAKPAPKGKRYILWDALMPSMGVRVTDKGHRSFLIQRRVNGRMVKITLGNYPAISLAEARDKAGATLKTMGRGIDPRQARPAPITASGQRKDSFEGAVETYIKRDVEKNRRPSTQSHITHFLRNLLVPRWGSLPLKDIGPRDIIEVLDELVDAGKPVAANRAYSVLHRFFRWCVERHLVPDNPAATVRKPFKEESRTRALSDDELAEVWAAAVRQGWPFGHFIRGLILTGQRRNELAGMTRAELDDEIRHWTIPDHRTKNAKEQLVPLSAAMKALLTSAPIFGPEGEAPEDRKLRPIFTTNGRTGISGFSRAKARLDADILAVRQKLAADAGRDPEDVKAMPGWTLHDLRRSCATGMGRIGITPHVIEAVLNHASGFRAGIAGVYQRHPYLEERRHALDAWAAHVTSLGAPRAPSANVVPFKKSHT